MFEQTFKNIDDILHKDAGCGSELDYQTKINNLEELKKQLFKKHLVVNFQRLSKYESY